MINSGDSTTKVAGDPRPASNSTYKQLGEPPAGVDHEMNPVDRAPVYDSQVHRDTLPEMQRWQQLNAKAPDQFQDRFLDVNFTVRMLERSVNRRYLVLEILVYMILFILYTVAFFTELYDSTQFWLNDAIGQEALFTRFRLNRTTVLLNTNLAGDATTAPLNGSNVDSFTDSIDFGEGEISTEHQVPGFVRECYSGAGVCVDVETESDFSSLFSKQDFAYWMDHFLSTSVFREAGSSSLKSFRGSSYVVGAVRVRQLRVKPNGKGCLDRGWSNLTTCAEPTTQFCIPAFSHDAADLEPFGGDNGDAFTHRTANELQELPYNGGIVAGGVPPSGYFGKGLKLNYPHDGYVMDLPTSNRSAALDKWGSAMDDGYIDEYTSAVFVSFTVYHPVYNSMASVSLLSEFAVTGQVTTQASLQTFRNPLGQTSIALLVVIAVSVALLCMWYANSLVGQCRQERMDRTWFWHVIDFLSLSLILSCLCISLWLRSISPAEYTDSSELLAQLIEGRPNPEAFSTFYSYYGWYAYLVRFLASIALLTCMVKIFKFLDLDQRFAITLSVIQKAMWPIASWALAALLLFFAFATSALLFYGPTMEVFANLYHATLTTFAFLISNFEHRADPPNPLSVLAEFPARITSLTSYSAFQYAGRKVSLIFAKSAIWYMFFVIFFLWILNNILLGIIVEGYLAVKKDMEAEAELRTEIKELAEKRKERNRAKLGRANGKSKDTWLSKLVVKVDLLLHHREQVAVYRRLKTEIDLRRKGLITYNELETLLADVVKPTRLDRMTTYFMAQYSSPLVRIRDAILLLGVETQSRQEDDGPTAYRDAPRGLYQENKAGEPVSGGQSAGGELTSRSSGSLEEAKSILGLESVKSGAARPSALFDEEDDEQRQAAEVTVEDQYDPLADVKWNRDMLSSDTLQSLVLVTHRHMDGLMDRYSDQLLRLQGEQREINAQLNSIINKWRTDHELQVLDLGAVETLINDASAATSNADNPWNVEQGRDGIVHVSPKVWEVHHMSENGIYRYVGAFETKTEAQDAYRVMVERAPDLDWARMQTAEEADEQDDDVGGALSGEGAGRTSLYDSDASAEDEEFTVLENLLNWGEKMAGGAKHLGDKITNAAANTGAMTIGATRDTSFEESDGFLTDGVNPTMSRRISRSRSSYSEQSSNPGV